jgi:hypothetical protein
MNPPLGIMLHFLVYISDGGMVRNAIECESVLGVYDLSAERGGCRLFEMKGRNWPRGTSAPGKYRLLEYDHKTWSLVAGTYPHSSGMIVIHSTQVPDAMAVDKVQRRSAMVVHLCLEDHL